MSHEGCTTRGSSFNAPLVLVALSFSSGIALADSISPPLTQSFLLLTLSLLLWIGRETNATFLVLVFMSGGLLHLLNIDAQKSAPFFDQLSEGSIYVTVEGVIVSPPENSGPSASRTRFDFQLKNITRKGQKKSAFKNRIRVDIKGNPQARYGDLFLLHGILKPPNRTRNPGSFEYARFLNTRGIYAEFSCHEKDAEKLATNQGNPIIAAGLRCREWVSSQITRGIAGDETEAIAIIKAMTLGQRSDTPDYLQDKFRYSGTLHVFAVSGLHVGIVAAITWFGISALVGIFGMHRNVAVLSVIIAVIAYAIITGLRPSAFRAAVMTVIFFGGMLFGREPKMFNSTAAAALVILLYETNQLFRPGFQLSFCVLISILAFANPIGKFLYRPFRIDPYLPKSLIPTSRRILSSICKSIPRF